VLRPDVLPNSLTNPDTKALLDSIQIEHHDDRAVLTATIPVGLLQKLVVPPDAGSNQLFYPIKLQAKINSTR